MINIVKSEISTEAIRKITATELKKFSILPDVLSYYYMRESIVYIIVELKNTPTFSVFDLYSTIAKKFNTSVSKVERAIRYGIEKAFLRNREITEKAIIEYFSMSYPKGKRPTNSEFLFTVAEYIKFNLL